MQLMWIDVSQRISLHNTIFRKNVRLVKEPAHMSASIGWQQSKDDVADRSLVPCHADFVSNGGLLSFFFFFFIRIFPFPPRHFSRPSCRYTVLKRVLKTATVFRSFVEDFHLNVIPASLLHRRDLHKFLSSEGREKKFVQPATICEQFLYRD